MADTQSGKAHNYTPILPYDVTAHEDFYMYDHFAYTRDLSLFDSNERMMNRGNIIHFYTCKMGEPKKIGGDVVDSEITAEEEIVPDADAASDGEDA